MPHRPVSATLGYFAFPNGSGSLPCASVHWCLLSKASKCTLPQCFSLSASSSSSHLSKTALLSPLHSHVLLPTSLGDVTISSSHRNLFVCLTWNLLIYNSHRACAYLTPWLSPYEVPEIESSWVCVSESLVLGTVASMLEIVSKYLQNENSDIQQFMHMFPGTGLFCKSGMCVYAHNLKERRKSGVKCHRSNRGMGENKSESLERSRKKRGPKEDSILSVYSEHIGYEDRRKQMK